MPNRPPPNYAENHPPSDGDRNKLAILWDERHDCEKHWAEAFNRIRDLESGMTKLEIWRQAGAQSSVWKSSLSTGLMVALFVYLLNHFGGK